MGAKCGEMLEDLLYFYNKGQLFCARDFASLMNIPRCSACDELIFSREYTGAEDRFWHFKHFCCFLCDIPLAGHKYIPEAGMPHCLACWPSLWQSLCNMQQSHRCSGSKSYTRRAALACKLNLFQVWSMC